MLALADEPQGTLFGDAPDLDGAIRPAKVPAPGVARVLMPHRIPIELRPSDLESLLPAGHRARRVWDSVARADVSRRYAGIRAVAGGRGRTAMAPEILFALWRYATLAGVGTARELARLTEAHDAYRWICGFGPPLTARACRSTTHPVGFPHGTHRGARWVADRQRRGLDGGWGGHAQAGGAGRDAGAQRRRSGLVSAR